MDEIKQLKSVLRSLVVSSPVQMTLSMLLRDYRNMMGSHLPIQKFGYRDPLQFLKERCDDCFLFQGFGTNTVLTPIVPECLKHIDDFVQKQNVSSKMKCKGKRRSVHESCLTPVPLIVKTFESNSKLRAVTKTTDKEKLITTSHSNGPPDNTPAIKHENRRKDTNVDSGDKCKSSSNSEQDKENKQNECVPPSKEAVKNFLRKRLPAYSSNQHLNNDDRSFKDSDSGKFTSESEQHTLSSSSSSSKKATQLEQLKAELVQIIEASPDGVCCTDLMKLYRERYNRELNFSRFGFLSVSALAHTLPVHESRDVTDGGVRFSARPPPVPARPARPLPRALHRAPSRALSVAHVADEEDALPWIDFDPDVFPSDCMSFSESIPEASLDGVTRGAMLEVMVGEVYSPSHFWFYRLGEQHHIAMEDMMDKMTNYYTSGEGAERTLAVGAVRSGHYCSSVYERDWHRSLIVNIVDSDTVKVRHVDYGTVDRVSVKGLKPLPRRWGSLPAQAIRARLAGVRPAARGRRWPHAAAAAFLRLVQDKKLVANVVSVESEESIVEVFLVDTATERDVRIDLELIRAGHADPATDVPTHALAESYLYPRFDALETGATPNFADIHAYLRDGIALEYVDDYSRHVPAALPPAPLSPPHPARSLDNRMPLCPRSSANRHETFVISQESDVEQEDSDVEPDSLESSEDEKRVDSAFIEGVKELSADDASKSSCESPPPPALAHESSKPIPEPSKPVIEPKPECRTAPRVCLPPKMHMGSQTLCPTQGASFGPPPFAAPSMPSLPFFVFPPPGQMQPYPPYPMHPAFPRPYPPMDCFLSPPQRCFQPQMRPPYSGPGYSPPFPPGPGYSSPFPPGPGYQPPFPPYGYPPCAHSSGLGPRPPVSVAPITSTRKTEPAVTSVSKAPLLPTPVAQAFSKSSFVPISVSQTFSFTPASKSSHLPTPVSKVLPATSVSKSQILATNVSRPLVSTAPTPAVTASVAPTPVQRREPETRVADQSRPPGDQPSAGSRRVTTGHGEVTLTVSECEIFNLLSSVDPNAAHWYIVDAISRAMATCTTDAAGAPLSSAGRPQLTAERLHPEAGSRLNSEAGSHVNPDTGSRLNPEASEFCLPPDHASVPRPAPPLRPPYSLRPPPGFGSD